MVFYEKIGTLQLMFHIIVGKSAFYWKKSFFLSFLWHVFPNFFTDNKYCKKINYCHIKYATDVLKNSYSNGMKFCSQIKHESFLKLGKNFFNIDFASIFKQFLFSEVVCSKYKFFELVIRYSDEHPDERHYFRLSMPLSNIYKKRLGKYGQVIFCNNYNKITFFFSMILSPIFLWSYWRMKGLNKLEYFENNIICNSPKVSTKNIFKEIFGDYSQALYVMSYPYIDRYNPEELEVLGITPMILDKENYLFLRKWLFEYIHICLKFYKELSIYDSNMFRLFYHIVLGREKAPNGKNNIFITFEHFNTVFAIRNEFIRLEGSVSVFFSEWIYPTAQYNPNEVYHNYDFICSSGKHLEETYLKKSMRIKNFLHTGGYDIHRGTVQRDDYSERISVLSDFKDSSIAVTILSSSVTHETLNTEIPLKDLANGLSRQNGVKVFIRIKDKIMKSKSVMSRSALFYNQCIKNNTSILLTGVEDYELMDFLPVTDLFITPNSTAGITVAMCGGQVIFADFDRISDLFLFYEKIKEICVPGEKVFGQVMGWIRDKQDGPIRKDLKDNMDKLRYYMGYTFPDFKTYKENLINQLRDNISFFPKRKESVRVLS